MTLVRTKSNGPSMARSLWLSAARCITASGLCLAKIAATAASSQTSACSKV